MTHERSDVVETNRVMEDDGELRRKEGRPKGWETLARLTRKVGEAHSKNG